jgi:hypothetical protein
MLSGSMQAAVADSVVTNACSWKLTTSLTHPCALLLPLSLLRLLSAGVSVACVGASQHKQPRPLLTATATVTAAAAAVTVAAAVHQDG